MINEQELAEAVERLRDGDDNGLLVKYGEVMERMRSNPRFVPTLMVKLFVCDNDIQEYFEGKFNEAATDILREAYITKLEHGAGL